MTETVVCEDCDTDLTDADTIGVSQEFEALGLPNYSVDLCLSCAVDEAMKILGTDDREEARHAVMGAISGE